jgi:4-hydroxy-tetrahydrodipicolinate synthase
LQRITEIRELAGGACKGVFGGANGMYLIDELQRGACGNMPAGGVVDVQVKIYEEYRAGNVQAAETLHFELLPLLTYASVYGVSFHKTVLWKRGVLA